MIAYAPPVPESHPHLFPCAQSTEVFRRPRHGVFEELERYAPHFFPLGQAALGSRDVSDLDVDKNSRVLGVSLPQLFLLSRSLKFVCSFLGV